MSIQSRDVQVVHSNVETHARAELDSHANMIVMGNCCFVFESTGKTCDVKPFMAGLGTARNIPIVDTAIAYDCPYEKKTFILLFRNALYIPEMNHCLIPPFILREGGLIVNEIPKFQSHFNKIEAHCIKASRSDLCIHLQLSGIFSYFPIRKPTMTELYDCDKVFMTPDSSKWNPHSQEFSTKEMAMLDFNGNLISNDVDEKKLQQSHKIYPVDDPTHIISTCAVDDYNKGIDLVLDSSYLQCDVAELSSSDFCDAISQRCEISKVAVSIGAVSTNPGHLLSSASFSSINADNSKGISSKSLSKLWNISHDLATQTLQRTTQLLRHKNDNTLSRNFSTNDRMLRYRRLKSIFFTDTLMATKFKSLRQNTCCQVFVSDRSFIAVYPMRSQSEFGTALHWFCKQVGVPSTLVADKHRSQTSYTIKRFCDQIGTTLRVLERHTPWSNRAELYIGILKEAVRKDLRQSNSPMILWDYAIERRALIYNLTPRPLFQLNGLTPYEFTFGEMGDISNLCVYGWYEWIYFRDFGSFPTNKEQLGRVLGPTENDGNEMAQSVLTIKGTVVTRRTLRKLRWDELHSSIEKSKREHFDKQIHLKLGDSISIVTQQDQGEFVRYEDDDLQLSSIPRDGDPVDDNGKAVFERPMTDLLINAEVILPHGDQHQSAKVISKVLDNNGNYIGTYDSNPILNTLLYNVKFSDGTVREYTANTIMENMYSQVDYDGQSYALLDSIVDYRKTDEAVSSEKSYIYTKSGQRRQRKTTIGWELLVAWRDGSESWIPLNEMKQSNPIEVAEFAVAQNIQDEPAFSWWVPYILRKRDNIVSAINVRVKKTNHKYGIQIPRTIDEAYKIDKENNNNLWRAAIDREMENLKVAFDILPESQSPPPGYEKASGHLVFDVRMTLERKARWVKDGHRTPEPTWSTYAGVVSRESVRIAFTYAALNNLQVCAADIQNAYLQAPSSEKHYVVCGPEFGLENVGRKAIIVRALYGGKSAGADYWRHVRKAMEEMSFESCKADPDVWMRPGTRADGTTFWEYVLLYTDDILAIMENPESFLRDELGQRFTLKEKSIGPPTQYLGNKVSQIELMNGVKCWSFSSSQYIQNAVKNVEKYLALRGETLPGRGTAPWPNNYRPEADVSPELPPEEANYFQSLIGVLRWIVELGRIDITMETSAMASMMAMPREGHLKAVLHMFSFLKKHHNGVLVFDPSVPEIDRTKFRQEDWSATPYGNCIEEIPSNAPLSRGIGFLMRALVDSDFAGDLIIRRSRTGFIIYLNGAPIYWFSKRQTCIETSSFGAEFIAMKQCCEYVRGLRYKLRMMGISIEEPTFIFGDNQSVLTNSSVPHSTLKKKSSSIAFHFVREGVARSEWRTAYLNTHYNPSDMLTKSLPGGQKRTRFTSYLLHYV